MIGAPKPPRTEVVLDASALLATINGEPGAENVAAALAGAVMSTVNLTEVVTKMIDIGIPEDDAWREAIDLVPRVVDFGPELCRRAAQLRSSTRALGLSLGDRACLALAQHLGLPTVTADQAWRGLLIGVRYTADPLRGLLTASALRRGVLLRRRCRRSRPDQPRRASGPAAGGTRDCRRRGSDSRRRHGGCRGSRRWELW
jgi:ribonuclease VapC